MDEEAVRAELIRLLRYANKTAIADALGLSPQAVINWSEGRNTSEGRLREVRALYGLDTETPPLPVWERRWESLWNLLMLTAGASGVELEILKEIEDEIVRAGGSRSRPPAAQRRKAGRRPGDEKASTGQ